MMIGQISQLLLKGYRFSRSAISYAVWADLHLALGLRDVEDLLKARGVFVSYETVRTQVRKLEAQVAKRIRAARRKPSDKWHLNEVVATVRDVEHCLWRAVDCNRDVPDILVQSRRNTRRVRQFVSKLITRGTCRW